MTATIISLPVSKSLEEEREELVQLYKKAIEKDLPFSIVKPTYIRLKEINEVLAAKQRVESTACKQ